MRPKLSASVPALVLILCLACSGGGPRSVSTPAGSGEQDGGLIAREGRSGPEDDLDAEREAQREVEREADPALVRAMEEALDRARAPGGTWHELHVATECADDASYERVELFGNGVGIWQGRRQFELDRDRLAAVLDLFRAAGFAGMPEMFGSEEDEIPVPQRPGPSGGPGGAGEPEPGPDAVLRVTCRVLLTLDRVTKQSNQLSDGPQSEALHRLAEGILDLCREAGEGGLRALDMADGLKKVAEGRLAPETLSLLLHHKPAEAAIERGEPAFLMRLRGERVTVRPFLGTRGYGDPAVLVLDREQVSRLANLLAGNGLGTLPANLYAEHYTDLTVDLLDQHAEVQARQFAHMTRASHGAAQTGFDRIYDGLARLARQVIEQGEPESR